MSLMSLTETFFHSCWCPMVELWQSAAAFCWLAAWDKDFPVEKEWGAQGTVRWCIAIGPEFSDRPTGKTGCTQQAPGKRPTPAPHDKRNECVQGQAQCLDHTSKEWEADALSQPAENVTSHQRQMLFTVRGTVLTWTKWQQSSISILVS